MNEGNKNRSKQIGCWQRIKQFFFSFFRTKSNSKKKNDQTAAQKIYVSPSKKVQKKNYQTAAQKISVSPSKKVQIPQEKETQRNFINQRQRQVQKPKQQKYEVQLKTMSYFPEKGANNWRSNNQPVNNLPRMVEKQSIHYQKINLFESTNKNKNKVLPGIKGLDNQGNTCYLNSALQCLSHTFILTKRILNQIFQVNSNNISSQNGQIFQKYRQFLIRMWRDDNVRSFDTIKIKKAIGKFNNQFADSGQKDSLELLAVVLDGLNEDLKVNFVIKGTENKQKFHKNTQQIENDNEKISDEALSEYFEKKYKRNNNSIITDLFTGQFKTSIKCISCSKNAQMMGKVVKNSGFRTFDCFNIIYLPIDIRYGSVNKNIKHTLKQCLKDFKQIEELSGQNSWFCKYCKKDNPSIKETSIYKTSEYLVFGLKRFKDNSKISDMVDFGLHLDMNNFVLDKQQNTNYSLYAVINHFGSLKAGHYTAFCMNQKKQWFEFDDSRVQQISQKQVISKYAYALFYKRD